jgi:hypothetical protein
VFLYTRTGENPPGEGRPAPSLFVQHEMHGDVRFHLDGLSIENRRPVAPLLDPSFSRRCQQRASAEHLHIFHAAIASHENQQFHGAGDSRDARNLWVSGNHAAKELPLLVVFAAAHNARGRCGGLWWRNGRRAEPKASRPRKSGRRSWAKISDQRRGGSLRARYRRTKNPRWNAWR